MKQKLLNIYRKYIQPFLTVLLIIAIIAAIIAACELYQYLALNVWAK